MSLKSPDILLQKLLSLQMYIYTYVHPYDVDRNIYIMPCLRIYQHESTSQLLGGAHVYLAERPGRQVPGPA